MRFQFIGYNPCSLVQTRRLLEISEAMRSAAFIAMTGTRLRASPGAAVWSQNQGVHHFVHFGYGRGPFTNRSAGVTIGIHKNWYVQGKIYRMASPPDIAMGRGGLVRIITKHSDISLFSLYLSPVAVGRACSTWKKTVDVLLQ